MALRAADRRTGLLEALDAAIVDPRDPDLITHRQIDLLRQRVYGLAAGYEDLNDHDTLRGDLLWQSVVERDSALASNPTLCRLENRADRDTAWAISRVIVEQFISSFSQAPEELILDFDATDDRVHGMQAGRAFHGYYGDWCFLPLYVFCGEQLLVSYLRPSNIDAARHAWAILKLLVARLREEWPGVRIIFRGDSGFCRWKMLRWCDRHGVDYIVGLAKNARLLTLTQDAREQAARDFEDTGEKQRRFVWIDYAAQSWDRQRCVIAKAEHTAQGANPRFVLTSASGWWANQLRLLLSSAAYLLLETIRRVGLAGSELARAQAATIRLKVLKIGTVILRNTRRIRLLFSSSYPHQSLFAAMLTRLSSASSPPGAVPGA